MKSTVDSPAQLLYILQCRQGVDSQSDALGLRKSRPQGEAGPLEGVNAPLTEECRQARYERKVAV